MRKHTLCVSLLALSSIGALPAQDNNEKPPIYVYVSEWAVPRAEWAAFEKNDAAEKAMMDKLVANKTLTGYGTFSNLIHQEGEPTHGSWMMATSEGRIAKALEMVMAAPTVASPALTTAKHWDYMMVSRTYNSRPGSWTGGYLAGAQWVVNPGGMRDYTRVVKSTLVPMLDQLVTHGTLLSYGMMTEDFHTGPMGKVTYYYTVADSDGLDKVSKAFDDAFDRNPTAGMSLNSLTSREGHRDFLDRVHTMTNQ